jgi:hypothetical protein
MRRERERKKRRREREKIPLPLLNEAYALCPYQKISFILS